MDMRSSSGGILFLTGIRILFEKEAADIRSGYRQGDSKPYELSLNEPVYRSLPSRRYSAMACPYDCSENHISLIFLLSKQ
uniref:hypothetical protein n=1 Tax=Kosakonia cowanii TaxID=208223 RepID=UPI00293C0145|nr:hypothetical protein [Kosakonia cowanii]